MILPINDRNGQTEKWWTNFLMSLPSVGPKDLEKSLAEFGARVYFEDSDQSDKIIFDRPQDYTFFCLRFL